MADLKRVVNYTLKTPFPYAKSGDMVDATFLSISAPTSRHARACSTLKQVFARAGQAIADTISDEAAAEAEANDHTPTGGEVLMMLATSKVVDYADVIEVGRGLLVGEAGVTGLALVDGEEKLTNGLVDDMDLDDLEGAVGAFLAGFTVPSVTSMAS